MGGARRRAGRRRGDLRQREHRKRHHAAPAALQRRRMCRPAVARQQALLLGHDRGQRPGQSRRRGHGAGHPRLEGGRHAVSELRGGSADRHVHAVAGPRRVLRRRRKPGRPVLHSRLVTTSEWHPDRPARPGRMGARRHMRRRSLRAVLPADGRLQSRSGGRRRLRRSRRSEQEPTGRRHRRARARCAGMRRPGLPHVVLRACTVRCRERKPLAYHSGRDPQRSRVATPSASIGRRAPRTGTVTRGASERWRTRTWRTLHRARSTT